MPYPPEFEVADTATNSTDYVTGVDVVGPGYVEKCCVRSITQAGSLKITIDGYVIELTTPGTDNYHIVYSDDPTSAEAFALKASGVVDASRFWFKNGFKAEIKTVSGGTFHLKAQYAEIN